MPCGCAVSLGTPTRVGRGPVWLGWVVVCVGSGGWPWAEAGKCVPLGCFLLRGSLLFLFLELQGGGGVKGECSTCGMRSQSMSCLTNLSSISRCPDGFDRHWSFVWSACALRRRRVGSRWFGRSQETPEMARDQGRRDRRGSGLGRSARSCRVHVRAPTANASCCLGDNEPASARGGTLIRSLLQPAPVRPPCMILAPRKKGVPSVRPFVSGNGLWVDR